MTERTLDDLYAEARQFGTVTIYGSEDGTSSCVVTFRTPDHTELKARSGFGHQTPHQAVQFAIDVARSLVTSIKRLPG